MQRGSEMRPVHNSVDTVNAAAAAIVSAGSRTQPTMEPMESHDGVADDLPPQPPLPPSVEYLQAEEGNKLSKHDIAPITRPGFGKNGQLIKLVTNHFEVSLKTTDEFFYQYFINLEYEDGRRVDRKGVGRKVIEKLQQDFATELSHKDFAYDGDKSLFTIGALPKANTEFVVVLVDVSSGKTAANGRPGNDIKRPYQSKTVKVDLCFAAKIPISAIAMALKGQESEQTQEAIRVINIILRQHSAKEGCLLVRQSFFRDEPLNFEYLGEGVMGFKGFHSSFRATQGGLSLNIDVSTTIIVQPGPVLEFLLAQQKLYDPNKIDWAEAKRALKNLWIQARPTDREFKIFGLSERNCSEQMFSLKQNKNGKGDPERLEISVYDYFHKKHGIDLMYSGNYPCINVGRQERPVYFPIELCTLVPLQRYTKSLSTLQRLSLVDNSRQIPLKRMSVLSDVLKRSSYDIDPMLSACGVSISQDFTQVTGRVLQPPMLKGGNGQDIVTTNGRWNFNDMNPFKTIHLKDWAVINFSATCDCKLLVCQLIKCGVMKGFKVDQPLAMFEENCQVRDSPAPSRVKDMFERVEKKLLRQLHGLKPTFLLCVLAEKKTSNIYGPWKRKCLVDFGVVTQCVAPSTAEVNDQYLTNVLLKINAKLGGMNSFMKIESLSPPLSNVPTMILGMDVSHGSPGQSAQPSVAAVVSSCEWPSVSKYRASVRFQPANLEMIDSLFKPGPHGIGEAGIIRECLIDFYISSKRKPDQIIIFRDGVSESQFNQVLNIELDQIIKACKCLDKDWDPKFTVIVAQKNHHTRFFIPRSQQNVPPGTVIDSAVCHPRNHDFYMCAHAGTTGTTRPTHYHILHDDIHFTPDDLQDLVHSLCYVYQGSTTAISIVAPIRYAHLAAAQVAQFISSDKMLSESDSEISACSAPAQELPRLHEDVKRTMFFC